MSSPPRRRHKSSPMEEIQGTVRATQKRLPELDPPPPANRGSGASSAETNDRTCREGDICQGAPKARQDLLELDKLPEDMLQHIHSLLPLQDAARAACVSRRFVHSWRCYSNLILNRETVGMNGYTSEGSEVRYINKIDQILNNYSGNGMKLKTLSINIFLCDTLSALCLDRWLRIAVKSGMNELSLSLPYSMKEKYRFPYSVLFDETANSSIQSLDLSQCIFQPIETLGCFRKLNILDLYFVHITEEGLNQLLSKSSGLERLQIYACSEIICLKIPCTLQKLKSLTVKGCHKMQGVEISAPNLSTFHYNGFPLEISIRDPSQLKYVYSGSFEPSRILFYGAKHPSIARNDERLTLLSRGENVNTAMRPDKLLHLKILEIQLYRSRRSPMYDIFSLGSFLYAFLALESFILHAERNAIIHSCVAGDDAYLMGESAYLHNHLKRVKITGFHSDKGLIRLVIHILQSSPSLEAFTLDTTYGYGRKPGDSSNCIASVVTGKCCWMSERDLKDVAGAVEAAGRYIIGRVPQTVESKLLEPCRRCYTGNQ